MDLGKIFSPPPSKQCRRWRRLWSAMNEKELVRRSKDGDEEAYGALVNAYKAKVFNMAYSLTRNIETADDLAQEVFIKAYVALPKFREKSSFGTWLYRIAINRIKDHLRKGNPAKHIPFEETMSDHTAQEDEIVQRERQMEQQQKSQLIHESLGMLPEKYRLIISLRDIQGFAYEELARILNISPGTVDSRLHRARKMLRKKIEFLLEREGGRL